jgi:hypothetical protein
LSQISHYAECRYAECRGASKTLQLKDAIFRQSQVQIRQMAEGKMNRGQLNISNKKLKKKNFFLKKKSKK